MKHLDDTGMAYVYTMVVVLLVAAGVVFAFQDVVLNPIVTEMNSQIDDGHVSAQTVDFFNMGLAFVRGLPGIFVLFVFIYVAHEAYKRKTEGR